MTRDLVPELHDIGKLTDLWSVRAPHNFEAFDFSGHGVDASTPTWQGILEHHCGGGKEDEAAYKRYPVSRNTFLLCLADRLASGTSRAGKPPRGEKGGSREAVQKVWRTPSPRPFTPIQAGDAARFVAADPGAEEYYQRYGNLLAERAEETRRPVTSLRVHSELTGKLYRLLDAVCAVDDEQIRGKTMVEVSKLLEDQQKKTKLTFARLKPLILARPFRTKDLAVFASVSDAFEELLGNRRDNVLFRAPGQVLVACRDAGELETMMATFKARGLGVEGSQITRPVAELDRPDFVKEAVVGERQFRRYPDLNQEIAPPICEICQMAPGARPWTEDESHEWLCDTCFQTRSRAPSLSKLAGWESGPVAWVQVELGLPGLVDALESLYADLLAALGIQAPAEVRFSMLAQFGADYARFLSDFANGLSATFGGDSVEEVQENLHCLRVTGPGDFMKLLRLYRDGMQAYFPRFLQTGTASIRLAASLSPARFPFFEHHRLLQGAEADIYLNIVGQGELRAPLKALDPMIAVAGFPGSTRALHNLAAVARVSESLAHARLSDKSDRDRPAFQQITGLLPLGLDYQSILTLARILEA